VSLSPKQTNLKRRRELDPNQYRIEIKNLNSLKFLTDACWFEIQRQFSILSPPSSSSSNQQDENESKMDIQNQEEIKEVQLKSETRGYNSISNTTFPSRSKESVKDYRFLLDPDLPPLFSPKERVFYLLFHFVFENESEIIFSSSHFV